MNENNSIPERARKMLDNFFYESEKTKGNSQNPIKKLSEFKILTAIEKQKLYAKVETQIGVKAAKRPKNANRHFFASNAQLKWLPVAASVIILVTVAFVLFKPKKNLLLNFSDKQVNIENQAFSSQTSELKTATIGSEIRLWLRGIYQLKALQEQSKIHLSLTQGNLAVHFDHSSAINTLIIKTPNAQFVITGTEFILWVSHDETKLLVKSSQVTVILSNDDSKIIHAGEIFSTKQLATRSVDVSKASSTFEEFTSEKNNPISLPESIETIPKQDSENTIVAGDKIQILLRNGQTIVGKVVKIDSNEIILENSFASSLAIKQASIRNIKKIP